MFLYLPFFVGIFLAIAGIAIFLTSDLNRALFIKPSLIGKWRKKGQSDKEILRKIKVIGGIFILIGLGFIIRGMFNFI